MSRWGRIRYALVGRDQRRRIDRRGQMLGLGPPLVGAVRIERRLGLRRLADRRKGAP